MHFPGNDAGSFGLDFDPVRKRQNISIKCKKQITGFRKMQNKGYRPVYISKNASQLDFFMIFY